MNSFISEVERRNADPGCTDRVRRGGGDPQPEVKEHTKATANIAKKARVVKTLKS
jgi:hypothetical protein